MSGPVLNGFAPVLRLQGDVNRLLDGFFDGKAAQRGYSGAFPGVNMWEEGDCAYVESELPGLGLDDIEVTVTGKELAINGERKLASEAEGLYHRRERATGRFSRTLTLPWEIDADRVEAKLADGVLTVKLPKSDACKPKKVKLLTA